MMIAKKINTEFISIRDVSSHYTRCQACNSLTWLSSYSTKKFAVIFTLPVLPLKKIRVMDQCPICGHRGITAHRLYLKERRKNEEIMMGGFATDADNPDQCCQALRTLMIYDEEIWFLNVEKSYGPRFETEARVQHTIAQGLCRFGHYDRAIARCRAAIVLGAGTAAEELLESCLYLRDAAALDVKNQDLILKPKSAPMAYVPLASAGFIIALFILVQSLVALRGPNTWVVNGSLRSYSVSIDGETYTLPSGKGEFVKLTPGLHELRFDGTATTNFTYAPHPLQKIFNKELLVINPDETALLINKQLFSRQVRYMHGSMIHTVSGISIGNKKRSQKKGIKGIELIRLENERAMVDRLMALDEEKHARLHALKSVEFTPGSPEAEPLLYIALKNENDAFIHSFLQPALARSPTLFACHKYYQDHMKLNHPDQDLVPEYKARCSQHPDEPENLYLLARVIDTPSISRGFYEASEKGRGMQGLGFHAISHDCFARSDYADALKYSEDALRLDPDNKEFIALKTYTLLASRDYAELVRTSDAKTLESALDRVLYLTLDGYHGEAEELANQFKSNSKEASAKLNAVRYHAVGNVDAYLHYTANSGDANARFISLIFQNSIDFADSELPSVVNHAWWQHLVLYCAAMNSGQTIVAEKNLETAISELSSSSLEHLKLRSLLTTTQPPKRTGIMGPECTPAERALTCLVLSHRFPKFEKEYKDLAAHLNILPTYPYLLIKRWSEGRNESEQR